MKKLFALLILLTFTTGVFSQAPEKMSYQAVIRNASGELVKDSPVGMKISILQGSVTGIPVYIETQTETTNENGLVTIEIGDGNIISGTFVGIDWPTGIYFLKTETDPTGGTNYTIIGASQLLSVPYALYSKTALTALNSQWITSGSSIYYNSGKVGIGTSTPVTYIHAHGAPITSRGQLSLSAPSGQDTFISFYEENIFKAYLWYDVSDQDLRLQNSTAGDLNLNPYGGRIGIGTNTPAHTLDVSGNVNFSGALYQNGAPYTFSWANITGKPTTISGYGITDAVTTTLDIAFIESIKKGDNVVTIGGIYGRIESVSDYYVTLDVAEGVILKVKKNALRRP